MIKGTELQRDWEHTQEHESGEGESGKGEGTSQNRGGFWEVAGDCGESSVGIENGDGRQAAGC